MKLIIQIPCLNEQEDLPRTLSALPKQIEGLSCIETLVIDDGSTDRTVAVAEMLGVDHLVRLSGWHGLARAFQAGIVESLKQGADVIVNLDGDNQYPAHEIQNLIRPILEHKADWVIGERCHSRNPEVPRWKRLIHFVGSRAMGWVCGYSLKDASSGFRAFSRDAALNLRVRTRYSYTMETLIQAGALGMRLQTISVLANPVSLTRKSRLIKSIPHYLWKSAMTVIVSLIIHRVLSNQGAQCFHHESSKAKDHHGVADQ